MKPQVYLTIRRFKTAAKIKNNNSDDLIHSILIDANIEVDKIIAPYAQDIPIVPGDTVSRYGTELALTWVKYAYYRDLFQTERAELLKAEFAMKTESMINVLKAHRTRRTVTAIFSTNPNDDQLILPNQKYDTILD